MVLLSQGVGGHRQHVDLECTMQGSRPMDARYLQEGFHKYQAIHVRKRGHIVLPVPVRKPDPYCPEVRWEVLRVEEKRG